MIIHRSVLFGMRNFSDKCSETQNTLFSVLIPTIVSYVKSCGKYGIARQVADDSIIRRIALLAGWLRLQIRTQNM
jgi:hypothetical protein